MFADELSQYELLRLQNVAERQNLIAALMKDAQELQLSLNPPVQCQPKPVRKLTQNKPKHASDKTHHSPKQKHYAVGNDLKDSNGGDLTECPWLQYATHSPPRTRSRGAQNTSTELQISDGSHTGRGTVRYRFPFMQPASQSLNISTHELDDYEEKCRSGRVPRYTLLDPNVDVLMPEQVTAAMLAGIAQRSTGKVYSAGGSTCHQCRQKTLDVKSVCRSLRCVGVRGFFCGPCLVNRYGERVEDVLLDPCWSCPPCRGICNCSICRARHGQPPTGALINLARARGYDNVNAYLVALLGDLGDRGHSPDRSCHSDDGSSKVKNEPRTDGDEALAEDWLKDDPSTGYSFILDESGCEDEEGWFIGF